MALLAFFAYWRTRRRLMGYLFGGFILIPLGSFWKGFFFQVLRWDLLTVHVVESALVLTGPAGARRSSSPGGLHR